MLGMMLASAASLSAQTNVPPERGGRIASLGLPAVYEGSGAVMAGVYRADAASDAVVNAAVGVRRYLGSPIVGVAALGLEGYGGVRGSDVDAGGRLLFQIPALHVSVGADYDVTNTDLDLLLRLEIPLRRGGLFGGGSQLRFDYLPTRANSFAAGFTVPLWGSNQGSTRPKQNAVQLASPRVRRESAPADPGGELAATLDSLRTRAHWIARFVMPFQDRGGADPETAYAESLRELSERLAGRTVADEMDGYYRFLTRAFSLAGGVGSHNEPLATGLAAAMSAAAREVLLDEVLLPYDRLLGQRKLNDGLEQYYPAAQARFARWLLNESNLPDERMAGPMYVFQTLLDVVEDVRAAQRQRWDDSRFGWLPLQLALTPEQYDTQAKLDAIIARAVEQPFDRGNNVWYVMNESFQFEISRSVLAAEDYHVLWIHDYRGYNDAGDPDAMGFAQTLESYLHALTQRVREYDTTGKLPIYMIFLDQHYFEINKSRLYLRILQDPLDNRLRLPSGFEEWEARMAAAQDSLRAAVRASRLLQAERAQYGDAWLANRIKVHVNITNPSDFSFQSFNVAGIFPVPDNIMRDHRKIAFYDLTDEDPYRGLAMFTGMGIGEHYVGPDWEDRAVMIRGPAALAVRDAARRLLLAQGLSEEEIPLPLRASPRPPDYASRIADHIATWERETGATQGGVFQLHNETGYAPKPIDVEKAILYSLMPAGSVLKIPDSLWLSYVYGSLLAGSALRGCTVMIFAPSRASAPSAAGPTLARFHGLFSALIYVRNALTEPMESAGGRLLVGLYHPRAGVGDVRGRLRQVLETSRTSQLAPFSSVSPEVMAVLDSLDQILDEVGYREPTYLAEGDTSARPKLHLKANLFLSKAAVDVLDDRPEWGPITGAYIRYIARQTGPIEGRPDARTAAEGFRASVLALMAAVIRDSDPSDRQHALAYFTVGSANMDYRSMVMDGEVMVTLTGWHSISGIIDFAVLEGLTEWIESQDELDSLLPPPSGMARWIGNLMRLAL